MDKELFLQSYHRCVASEAFIPAFYECFLGASEEISNKFRFTNFEKQDKMLRLSLEACAAATDNESEALREIRKQSRTHDRHHLNIEPRFYDIWLETIIATARDFDDHWTDEVEAAWRRPLSHVMQYIFGNTKRRRGCCQTNCGLLKLWNVQLSTCLHSWWNFFSLP